MLCSDFDPDRKAVINPEDNFSPLPGFPKMCMGVYSQPIVESLLQRFGGGGDPGPALLQRPGARVPGPGLGPGIRPVRAPCGRGRLRQHDGGAGGPRRAVLCVLWLLRGAAERDHRRAPDSAHCRRPGRRALLPLSAACGRGGPDPACVAACRQALESLGLPFVEGKTWTTDGFYRETRGKVRRRREQGCLCVEMECASLAAVAQFRGLRFAQFFFAADNLDAPAWDARGLPHLGRSVGDQCFAAAVEAGRRLLALP